MLVLKYIKINRSCKEYMLINIDQKNLNNERLMSNPSKFEYGRGYKESLKL